MGFDTPEEGYLAKIIIESGTKDVPIGKVSIISAIQLYNNWKTPEFSHFFNEVQYEIVM